MNYTEKNVKTINYNTILDLNNNIKLVTPLSLESPSSTDGDE